MARIAPPEDMPDSLRIYVRKKFPGRSMQFVPFRWWDNGSTFPQTKKRIQFDRIGWPFMEEEEAEEYTVRVEE